MYKWFVRKHTALNHSYGASFKNIFHREVEDNDKTPNWIQMNVMTESLFSTQEGRHWKYQCTKDHTFYDAMGECNRYNCHIRYNWTWITWHKPNPNVTFDNKLQVFWRIVQCKMVCSDILYDWDEAKQAIYECKRTNKNDEKRHSMFRGRNVFQFQVILDLYLGKQCMW